MEVDGWVRVGVTTRASRERWNFKKKCKTGQVFTGAVVQSIENKWITLYCRDNECYKEYRWW